MAKAKDPKVCEHSPRLIKCDCHGWNCWRCNPHPTQEWKVVYVTPTDDHKLCVRTVTANTEGQARQQIRKSWRGYIVAFIETKRA